MRTAGAIVVLATAVLLSGCVGQAQGAPEWHQGPVTTEGAVVDEGLPEAARAFAAHFTDAIYDDPADEFAPFGTDEGSDMLFEWADRRDELHSDTTVADLIDESGFDGVLAQLDIEEGPGIPEPAGQVDAATITIGAGFTLLRLTGHIDERGRQQTLRALDILIRHYGPQPQLLRQRADLESWTG